jgi:uncharacterized delta-60 repeat protein
MNLRALRPVLLAIVASIAFDRGIAAHEGDLDPSFNGSGKLVFSIDPAAAISTAYAVAIDAEGRIVIAGSIGGPDPHEARWGVARLDDAGHFDPTFGSGGKVTIALGSAVELAVPYAMAIEDDGGIVLAGSAGPDLAIARLDASGALDPEFGTGGIWLANPGGGSTQPFIGGIVLEPQPEGGQMIVFAGGSDSGSQQPNRFLRGYIDSTGRFPHIDLLDPGPYDLNAFNAIVAEGTSFLMIGSSHTDVDSDCSVRRYRLRYNGIGLLQFFDDPAFASTDFVLGTGAGSECTLHAATIPADGSIVIGGEQYNGDIATDGAFVQGLDAGNGNTNGRLVIDAFAPDEGGVGSMRAVLAQSDGKIVLAGFADTGAQIEFIVQRRAWLPTSVARDPGFGNDGTTAIEFDDGDAISESAALGAAFDAKGRVVVVGYSYIASSGTQGMAVARLQGDPIFRDGFDGP